MCVFFLLRVRRLFSLHIINFPSCSFSLSLPLSYSPFCNRQMKVRKKNALNTYVSSRTMRPSVTTSRCRRRLSFLRLSFSLSLPLPLLLYLSFRSFSSHSIIHDCTVSLCPNGKSSSSFRPQTYCVSSLFLYIDAIRSSSPFDSFFSSSSLSLSRQIDSVFFFFFFFCMGTFFIRQCVSLFRFLTLLSR